jgi:hypothetical protein
MHRRLESFTINSSQACVDVCKFYAESKLFIPNQFAFASPRANRIDWVNNYIISITKRLQLYLGLAYFFIGFYCTSRLLSLSRVPLLGVLLLRALLFHGLIILIRIFQSHLAFLQSLFAAFFVQIISFQ